MLPKQERTRTEPVQGAEVVTQGLRSAKDVKNANLVVDETFGFRCASWRCSNARAPIIPRSKPAVVKAVLRLLRAEFPSAKSKPQLQGDAFNGANICWPHACVSGWCNHGLHHVRQQAKKLASELAGSVCGNCASHHKNGHASVTFVWGILGNRDEETQNLQWPADFASKQSDRTKLDMMRFPCKRIGSRPWDF